MSNMSHCRFENTLADLQDCYENMDNEDLSKSEETAKEKLIQLCSQIAWDYEEGIDIWKQGEEEKEG